MEGDGEEEVGGGQGNGSRLTALLTSRWWKTTGGVGERGGGSFSLEIVRSTMEDETLLSSSQLKIANAATFFYLNVRIVDGERKGEGESSLSRQAVKRQQLLRSSRSPFQHGQKKANGRGHSGYKRNNS